MIEVISELFRLNVGTRNPAYVRRSLKTRDWHHKPLVKGSILGEQILASQRPLLMNLSAMAAPTYSWHHR